MRELGGAAADLPMSGDRARLQRLTRGDEQERRREVSADARHDVQVGEPAQDVERPLVSGARHHDAEDGLRPGAVARSDLAERPGRARSRDRAATASRARASSSRGSRGALGRPSRHGHQFSCVPATGTGAPPSTRNTHVRSASGQRHEEARAVRRERVHAERAALGRREPARIRAVGARRATSRASRPGRACVTKIVRPSPTNPAISCAAAPAMRTCRGSPGPTGTTSTWSGSRRGIESIHCPSGTVRARSARPDADREGAVGAAARRSCSPGRRPGRSRRRGRVEPSAEIAVAGEKSSHERSIGPRARPRVRTASPSAGSRARGAADRPRRRRGARGGPCR